MVEYVYQLQGLSKAWPGGRKLFENINLSFLPDAKIGIVGVNGAGKSTLLRIMAGQDKEFVGEAIPAPGLRIGHLPQEPQLDPTLCVGDNVASQCVEKQLFDEFNAASIALAEEFSEDGMEKMNALQEQIEALNAWDIDSRIDMAMAALHCPPKEAEINGLSGGEARRVAICRLLLSKPDMILMDEPTNHLDAETVAWLQAWLAAFPGCVILVTHDRYFLDQITGWMLEIDRNRGIPYKGNYSSWLEQKEQRLRQELRENTGRQHILARELAWVNSSPKARRAKSKARIKAYEEMASKAEKIKVSATRLRVPPGERLGDLVLEVTDLHKSIADKALISGLSFRLPPGAIAGIIGPNGAGKTTLLKLIAGKDQPDSGSLRLGSTVQIGYVDQSRQSLLGSNSVWEEISGNKDVLEIGGEEINSRAYTGSFNFHGSDQQKRVGSLSGGERNRVHLAKMLQQNANLLLLDEPTNDLDVETLQSLEAALEDFPGCAMITSHDRWFLDRVATHILAFEGNGHVEWFEGDFSSYMEDRRKRLGPDMIERTASLRKFSRG